MHQYLQHSGTYNHLEIPNYKCLDFEFNLTMWYNEMWYNVTRLVIINIKWYKE